nr:EAL domain-containing protein [Vibrio viridaestus]
MAFQPIVNCRTKEIFGYEALVRGVNGESAYSIIQKVNASNRYWFDQQCRVKAIQLAAKLKIPSLLSINFLPNAIYKPERCIRTTLEAAKNFGFPAERIMFEFTEVEKIDDSQHIQRIINCYRELGFKTAIDDFGSGYSGLSLLTGFKTDLIKIDMELIRAIDSDKTRQSIVAHSLAIFNDLGITPIAEGIETEAEYLWLKSAGIDLMQGYLIAKPGFECLPDVYFPQS